MAGVWRAGVALGLLALLTISATLGRRHALSFLLGAALSLLNLRLLEQGVTFAIVRPKARGKASVIGRFLLRFVLLGALLCAMMLARQIEPLTATAGLSLSVFAIILKGFFDAARDLLAPARAGSPGDAGSDPRRG